jgi:hypothetical protein
VRERERERREKERQRKSEGHIANTTYTHKLTHRDRNMCVRETVFGIIEIGVLWWCGVVLYGILSIWLSTANYYNCNETPPIDKYLIATAIAIIWCRKNGHWKGVKCVV